MMEYTKLLCSLTLTYKFMQYAFKYNTLYTEQHKKIYKKKTDTQKQNQIQKKKNDIKRKCENIFSCGDIHPMVFSPFLWQIFFAVAVAAAPFYSNRYGLRAIQHK